MPSSFPFLVYVFFHHFTTSHTYSFTHLTAVMPIAFRPGAVLQDKPASVTSSFRTASEKPVQVLSGEVRIAAARCESGWVLSREEALREEMPYVVRYHAAKDGVVGVLSNGDSCVKLPNGWHACLPQGGSDWVLLTSEWRRCTPCTYPSVSEEVARVWTSLSKHCTTVHSTASTYGDLRACTNHGESPAFIVEFDPTKLHFMVSKSHTCAP